MPDVTWGLEPEPWMTSGVCRSTDPEMFYPEPGDLRGLRDAKRQCNGWDKRDMAPCPVRDQCIRYAIANDEQWGVWGGYSERDRRRLRGQHKRTGWVPQDHAEAAEMLDALTAAPSGEPEKDGAAA